MGIAIDLSIFLIRQAKQESLGKTAIRTLALEYVTESYRFLGIEWSLNLNFQELND
jgi:hypothetical protein